MTQPQLTPVGACEVCGKRHGPNWFHAGTCINCHEHPVMTSKRDAQFCDRCYNAMWAAIETPSNETPAWLARFGD